MTRRTVLFTSGEHLPAAKLNNALDEAIDLAGSSEAATEAATAAGAAAGEAAAATKAARAANGADFADPAAVTSNLLFRRSGVVGADRSVQSRLSDLPSVLDFFGASPFAKAQAALNSGLSFYMPDGLVIDCPDTLWMSMPSQMVYGSGAGCGFRLVRAAGQPVTPILVQLPSSIGSGLRGLMFDHAA
ncbi:hypothetical protein M0638_26960, partial [Roseomonas sp. NAR14]